MQTLGISDPTDHSDSRLKSLFWPSIQSGADVDYLGAQGYWVCTFIAGMTFLFMLLSGQYIMAPTLLLFFYFGGVGVRERDVFAAIIVFAYYGLDTLISLVFLLFVTPWGMIVLRVLISALLLSNLRATWIASEWEPTSEQAALPPRFGETFIDKFVDLWPAWIWPKVRIIYYVFALGVMIIVCLGVAVVVMRSVRF